MRSIITRRTRCRLLYAIVTVVPRAVVGESTPITRVHHQPSNFSAHPSNGRERQACVSRGTYTLPRSAAYYLSTCLKHSAKKLSSLELWHGTSGQPILSTRTS
ncbi:hypothetical protein F5Y14DRAFT_411633 [Nemania sp. NC0429]|nr:hypothetical protein F5Y14DRAFT_411633 [Nemania sp. NC0429]